MKRQRAPDLQKPGLQTNSFDVLDTNGAPFTAKAEKYRFSGGPVELLHHRQGHSPHVEVSRRSLSDRYEFQAQTEGVRARVALHPPEILEAGKQSVDRAARFAEPFCDFRRGERPGPDEQIHHGVGFGQDPHPARFLDTSSMDHRFRFHSSHKVDMISTR
jgi:hypothetical protein